MPLRLTCSLVLAATLATGCVGPSATPGAEAPGSGEPRPTRTLTVGAASIVASLGVSSGGNPQGGWNTIEEIHSNGLVTSDLHSRKPIGLLAERAPSFDDGSVSVLADGRMRVVFNLRKGITWHDGATFTAQDLVFSHQILKEPGLPLRRGEAVNRLESVEAPDDFVFIMNYHGPYYDGATLSVRSFWPQPRHLLAPAYENYRSTGNADDVMGLPYWTSEYIQLGAFRVREFDPGGGLVLDAYDKYFQGRPKVDVIRVQAFNDQSTLLSNLFAGTIDVLPDLALTASTGVQLKERWQGTGEGTVYARQGAPWSLIPQFRPSMQSEPANLDPRVRAGLYHAIDRETLSEAVNGGYRDLVAWGILPQGEAPADVTTDALKRFSYDPDRAVAILREAGWVRAQDGALRQGADGRRYHVELRATLGYERDIAATADYWRRLGIEVDELIVPGARVRDLEFRALYPGWEATGPSIIGSLVGPAASAQTRWVGSRPGYENPRGAQLVATYRASLSGRDRDQAIRAISDFVVGELPFMTLYWLADYLGVRKGVRALDDINGGGGAQAVYGGYFRNAHLWEIME